MTHDDCELLERIVYIHFELGASARLLGKVTEAEEAYQTAIRFGQNAIRSGVAS